LGYAEGGPPACKDFVTKRPSGKLWMTTFKLVSKLEHYQVNLRNKQKKEKPNSPLTCRRKRTGFSSQDKPFLNLGPKKIVIKLKSPPNQKIKFKFGTLTNGTKN